MICTITSGSARAGLTCLKDKYRWNWAVATHTLFDYVMHDRCPSIPRANDHNIDLRWKMFSAAMVVDGPNLFSPIGGDSIRHRERFDAGARKRHFGDVVCKPYACIGGSSTELS